MTRSEWSHVKSIEVKYPKLGMSVSTVSYSEGFDKNREIPKGRGLNMEF